MRAVVVQPRGPDPAVYTTVPDPEPAPGEVLVELRAAALNRTDLTTLDGRHHLDAPTIIGGDGAGVVLAAGQDADGHLVGAEVVILPSLDWGPDPENPSPRLDILGAGRPGTHAELVAVAADSVFPRPTGLTWEEAAALPLAGLTAWRAVVTKARAAHGSRVLVTGASGGVATFAVQLAASLGAEVHVTTSSDASLDRAVSLGAAGGVVRTDGWQERALAAGPFDAVIDSAGADWDTLIEALRIGGTLVSLGRTTGPRTELDLFSLFWRQITIQGTSMGSPSEFTALLDHVERTGLRPTVDRVMALAEGPAAYEALRSAHFGKIVLTPGTR